MYNISFFFYHRTLFELDNKLVFRYTSQQHLELVIRSSNDKNVQLMITSYDDVDLSGMWKSVFFTFEGTDGGQLTITTHFGSETGIDPVVLTPASQSLANTITSITIAEGFNGFLQDIRVYIPKLQTTNTQITVPTEASFLPQCLCRNGYSISQSEADCTTMDQSEPRLMHKLINYMCTCMHMHMHMYMSVIKRSFFLCGFAAV